MFFLQWLVFRLTCTTGPDHKTGRCRDCLGYGRCGGKPLQRQGHRVPLPIITLIILTHPPIPAQKPRPRRFSADSLYLTSPLTCQTPTYNNHPLLSSIHLHRKRTCTSRFSLSWASQISELRTQRSRFQKCPIRNLVLTSHSCSGTETFLNLVEG